MQGPTAIRVGVLRGGAEPCACGVHAIHACALPRHLVHLPLRQMLS